MTTNPVRDHSEVSFRERGCLGKGATTCDFRAGSSPHVCCWEKFKLKPSWEVGFQTLLLFLSSSFSAFSAGHYRALLIAGGVSGAELDRSPGEGVWWDSRVSSPAIGIPTSKPESITSQCFQDPGDLLFVLCLLFFANSHSPVVPGVQ